MAAAVEEEVVETDDDTFITTTKDTDNNEYNRQDEVLTGNKISRIELLEVVRKSGIKSSTVKKSPLLISLSEPSSPRKLYRPRKNTFDENMDDHNNLSTTSSSLSSTATITSEDGLTGSREFKQDDSKPDSTIPSLVISQEEDIDSLSDFRPRTGSQFYHESFSSAAPVHKPCLYLPTAHGAQQFTFSANKHKKQKGFLNRLRYSFNKHKSFVADKGQNKQAKQRKWIDHEDELDPVSRPSYFRHIGHVIKTGPGMVQTIQLNRPSEGKFGVYVAQGLDPESNSKSIFVSKFYHENLSMFYASLLRPGDEILAVNGRLVRDIPIARVIKLLAGLETVQLTILPINAKEIRDP